MSDSGEPWNPTPPGWTTTPKLVARGEEVWRATLYGRTIPCVLHDDSAADATWEVLLKAGWTASASRPDMMSLDRCDRVD